MLEFLNANQAIFTFLATLVTAIATIVLAWFTRILARETKVLAERTSRPFVVCNLESSQGDVYELNQVLRNTGNATAFDIEVQIDPPLPSSIAPEQGLPTRTVSLLPPGQYLQLTGVRAEEIVDKTFILRVSWVDVPNGKDRQSLSYNVSAKDGFQAAFNAKGLNDVATQLEKIQRHISMRGRA